MMKKKNKFAEKVKLGHELGFMSNQA